VRTTAEILNKPDAVEVDATTNTKYGHFLWTASEAFDLSKKSVYSETIFGRNYPLGSCFELKYLIKGEAAKINIYRTLYKGANSLQKTISSQSVYSKNWTRTLVDLDATQQTFDILVEADNSQEMPAYWIALDDFFLHNKTCASLLAEESYGNNTFTCQDGSVIGPDKVCNFINDCAQGEDEKKCADCDFEDSICQYEDRSFRDLIWERVQAGLSENGPTIDNTLKTPEGHYVYVSFSDSNENYFDYYNAYNGFYATLKLNRDLQPCAATCQLEFYYHMFGQTDDLVVFMTINDIEYDKIRLLHLRDDQGDQWNRMRVPISRVSVPFRLGFEGLRYMMQSDHDLALDDIKLIDCGYGEPQASCPAGSFTCTRKSCISLSRVCDLMDDCGDNSDEKNCEKYTTCDFESNLCDWSNDDSTNSTYLPWGLNRGKDDYYSMYAPSRDHTTGLPTGQYAYADFYENKGRSKARLVSPVFQVDPNPNSGCELRFFYHLYGSDIGALNVYVRESIGGFETPLLNKTRELGDFWERADLKINTNSMFQIVIEAVGGIGDGTNGDISIDDTSFTPACVRQNSSLPTGTTTTTVSTPSPCGNGKFQCVSDEKCIPDNQVCDFVPNCADKSDEANCGTCDFEQSACGWYDSSTNELKWTRRQAPSVNPNGPQIDHTFGTTKPGYFVITELAEDKVNWQKPAKLFGPKFQATSPYCKMSFWASIGSYSSYVMFYYSNVSNSDDFRSLGGITGIPSTGWANHVIDVGKHPADYQMEIRAYPNYRNPSNYNDIALDDIQFIDCAANELNNNQSLNCDFELDFCSYVLDTESRVTWIRYANKSNANSLTGPSGDHTTGLGYYALFRSYSGFPYNQTGIFY
jgi:hypothetical protein